MNERYVEQEGGGTWDKVTKLLLILTYMREGERVRAAGND